MLLRSRCHSLPGALRTTPYGIGPLKRKCHIRLIVKPDARAFLREKLLRYGLRSAGQQISALNVRGVCDIRATSDERSRIAEDVLSRVAANLGRTVISGLHSSNCGLVEHDNAVVKTARNAGAGQTHMRIVRDVDTLPPAPRDLEVFASVECAAVPDNDGTGVPARGLAGVCDAKFRGQVNDPAPKDLQPNEVGAQGTLDRDFAWPTTGKIAVNVFHVNDTSRSDRHADLHVPNRSAVEVQVSPVHLDGGIKEPRGRMPLKQAILHLHVRRVVDPNGSKARITPSDQSECRIEAGSEPR